MENIKFKLKFFFIFLVSIISLIFIKDYNHNKIIYLIYSLSINFLFIRTFFIKFYFSEFFISLFLWLSFWFAFTVKNILNWNNIITFYPSSEKLTIFSRSEGIINPKHFQSIIDETLLFCTFIFIFMIFFFSLLRKIIKPPLYNYAITDNISKFNFIYDKYKKYIIFFVTLVILLTSFLNFNYSIYQKGIIYDLNFGLLNSYIRWSFNIGLPILFSIVLFLEINSKNSKFFLVFFLVIFFLFIINLSLISRAMIIEVIVILIGVFYSMKNQKKKFINFFILSIFALIVSISSIVLVEKMRKKIYFVKQVNLQKNLNIYSTIGHDNKIKFKNTAIYKDDSNTFFNKKLNKNSNNSIFSSFNDIVYIALNRWVGIDAVLIVMSKKNILGLDFFISALKEKKNFNQFPFYERNFIDTTKDRILNNQNYGIILPGFIAFALYLNNIFLIFLILGFSLLLLVLFEKFSEKLMNNNFILISYVSYIVSYRFIHFGYVPKDSYLLFGSLTITLIFVFVIKKIIEKLNLKLC